MYQRVGLFEKALYLVATQPDTQFEEAKHAIQQPALHRQRLGLGALLREVSGDMHRYEGHQVFDALRRHLPMRER